MRIQPAFFIFMTLVALRTLAGAQLTGTVRDAETGEYLAAANIQIVGTLRGTITNNEGRFQLDLPQFPVTLFISYIGYESREIQITSSGVSPLHIELMPIILESETIIVTAEDPAMNIMRKVIENKLEWRKKLETYHAKAYSRLVLKNDSGIVSIAESISEAFWHREKGPREIIKSKRQTSNMNAEGNFANVSYIPNFYDDDIEINGFRIIGPTHPDALKYYRFKLSGKRMIDKTVVYDIEVIPTSRLQPTFVGDIAVLDRAYAMIAVDLKPNDTILFPPPIQEWNLFYKQQFSSFGRDFWLPVDVRISGRIKIGFTGLQFPAISYSQLSHLDDYQVNIILPDSLYEDEDIFTVDSTFIDEDTLFVKSPEVVPLSVEEENAYETLDSTMTIAEAFKPTGLLSRFVTTNSNADRASSDSSGQSFFSGFGPQLWFNKTDGFNLGVTYTKTWFDPVRTEMFVAFKTGARRWAYGGRVRYTFGEDKHWQLKSRYRVGSKRQFSSPNYSMTIAGLGPLLGQDDYFNYYWSKVFDIELEYDIPGSGLKASVGYNDAWHSNLQRTTNYNILGNDNKQPLNRQIKSGHFQSVNIDLQYGERVPFGVVGDRWLNLFIEHSLNSDYDFTNYGLNIDWRFDTFLQRRLLPNALDLRLTLATSQGDLPMQRLNGIDGSLYGFAPFGSFRTLMGKPYLGEQMAALFWEHNFRTVPFELVGLDYFARKGLSVILHGAHGRTWLEDKVQPLLFNTTDQVHHEMGISINSLFGLMRVDGTWRLDRPGFYLSVGLARFF